jgi:hypothetical protein
MEKIASYESTAAAGLAADYSQVASGNASPADLRSKLEHLEKSLKKRSISSKGEATRTECFPRPTEPTVPVSESGLQPQFA